MIEDAKFDLEHQKRASTTAFTKDWAKWKTIRDTVHPEPAVFQPLVYDCGQSIREKFKETGLQIIVKMASIELTPERSKFPAGGWHVSPSTQALPPMPLT